MLLDPTGIGLERRFVRPRQKHSRRIPLERPPSIGVVPSRLELTGSCARKSPEHFDDALSLAEFHASLEGAAGRPVHGLVKTVVGQHSRPVSIAARSLRQNSSSCFWRRAIASTLPSSMIRLRFDMMPPPTIRVGDAVTRSFESSTRGRSVRDFEVFSLRGTPNTSSNVGVFRARTRR